MHFKWIESSSTSILTRTQAFAGQYNCVFVGKAQNYPKQSIHLNTELFCREHSYARLIQLNQVHEESLLDLRDVSDAQLEKIEKEPCSADAMILPLAPDSSHLSTAFIIKTADCLPVFLEGKQALAIVHAGWRGLACGVLERAMALCGPLETITIWPHIGQQDYEVGSEVIEAIGSKASYKQGRGGKYLLDTGATAIALMRAEYGARRTQIVLCNESTFNSDRLHSYRRDKENRGSNALVLSYVSN